MYEIFEKLCELKGITPYRFGKDMEVNSSTISTWKKKNSLAGPELAEKVCDYFGVTIDFLMGKTDEIECPECGQKYNPLDEFDSAIHETYHEKILQAQLQYPSLIPYMEAAEIRMKNRLEMRNKNLTKELRLDLISQWMKADFSMHVCENYEPQKQFDYMDYCKTKIVKYIETGYIPEELIDDTLVMYGIDKSFINETDLLLARTSKSDQLMRILSYAEKLNPGMLDAIEIQLKALAEQNDKE